MSTDLETLYKHKTECDECGTTFVSDVERSPQRSDNGNYLRSWGWKASIYCPACEVYQNLVIWRRIDREEAYLPWRHYVDVYILGKDPAPDPRPTQDEQVEIVLDILGSVVDPIGDGVDWIIYDEEDMAPFWWAREQLDDEHYTELKQRARAAYGVEIDTLAEKGKNGVEERDDTAAIDS